jgi:hypothetical protein
MPDNAINVKIGGGRILRAINYPIIRNQKVEAKEFTPIFKNGRWLLDIKVTLEEAAHQGQTNSGGEADETDEETTAQTQD